MNESLTPTLEQKNSRRGLLALIGAGGAAAVAALLGRRNGAEAADNPTYHESSTATTAVHGNNTADGIGVEATGNAGPAMAGHSYSYIGVYGYSDSYVGVYGAGEIEGMRGNSLSGVGVTGSGRDKLGVWGVSLYGTGVKGEGKPGVYGLCTKNNGSGVRGDGDGPGTIGLFGKNTPGRRALRTKGKVQMDCARTKTLSARSTKVTLPAGVRAATNAAIMATVQGNPGNDAVIWRAYRVDSTHIRIAFNKAPANPVSVAYWVVHTG